MTRPFRRAACILAIFAWFLSLPIASHATKPEYKESEQFYEATDISISEAAIVSQETQEETDMFLIENPIIVSDGREQHQLSTDDLTADTNSLLQAVLNSEYIRIARTSARLLSSGAEPLPVHYSNFNGYLELLSRSDLETILISYVVNATDAEKEILLDMLKRDDMQNNLSESALEYLSSACRSSTQSTRSVYALPLPGDTSNPLGITYTLAGTITFVGGETINAYSAAREFTQDEIEYLEGLTDSLELPITLIHPSDPSYNCHSYAWYRMSNSNPYWIGYRMIGTTGYVSGDHMFIPNSAVNVGNNYQLKDIVVYYNESGVILHSAVIVDTDGETITVQSKWGACSVYRHEISTVPSSYLGNDGVLRYEIYRYHDYIRTTTDLGHVFNTHTYQHTDTCIICGHTVTRTETIACSGPPCVVPFSLIANKEVTL